MEGDSLRNPNGVPNQNETSLGTGEITFRREIRFRRALAWSYSCEDDAD